MENSNKNFKPTNTIETITTSSSVLASAKNCNTTIDTGALAGRRYPSSLKDQSLNIDDWHTSFDEECSDVLILGHKEIETLLAVDPKKSKKTNLLNMQYVSGMHDRWLKPMEAEIKSIKTLVAKVPAVDGAYNYLFPVWPCHEVKDMTVKATRLKGKGRNSRSRYVTISAQQQEQTCAILARKMAKKGWFAYFHQHGMDKRLVYCFKLLGKGELLCPYSKEMNARELSVVERLCYRHSFFTIFPEMKNYFKLTDAEGLSDLRIQAGIICTSLASSFVAVTVPVYGIPLLVTGATVAALALFNSKVGETVSKTTKMIPGISFCVEMMSSIRDKVSQMVAGLSQSLWGGMAILGSITVTAIVAYFCYRLVAARTVSQEAILQTAAVYGEASYPMPIVVEEKDSKTIPLIIAGLMTGISAHTLISKYNVLRRMTLDFTSLSTFPIKKFINFVCSCVGLEPVFDLLDYMQEYSVLRAQIQSMVADGAEVGDLLNAKADVRTFIMKLAKCKNPSHSVVRGSGELWSLICKEVRNKKVSLPAERIEPVVVAFLDKESGTGKSTSCARMHEIMHLRKQRFRGQFRDRDAATTKYMRNAEAFWSGVQPDVMSVVYEELCASTLPNVNVVRASELLDLVGTAPFSVPMADVESKGKVHLAPEFVFVTSNNEKHANSGMISNEALIRRMDFPLVSTIIEDPERDDHLDNLYSYKLAQWYVDCTNVRIKRAWHELREGDTYTFTEVVAMMERCSLAKKQRNQNYSAKIDYTGRITTQQVLDVSTRQEEFVAVPESIKDDDLIILNQQTMSWKALRKQMQVLGLVEDDEGNKYYTISEYDLPRSCDAVTYTGKKPFKVSNPQLRTKEYDTIHCGTKVLQYDDGKWVIQKFQKRNNISAEPEASEIESSSSSDDDEQSALIEASSEEDELEPPPPKKKPAPENILPKPSKDKEAEEDYDTFDPDDDDYPSPDMSRHVVREGVKTTPETANVYRGNIDGCVLTRSSWATTNLNMYATDDYLVVERSGQRIYVSVSSGLNTLCKLVVEKMVTEVWDIEGLCLFNDCILKPIRYACAGAYPRVANLDLLQQQYDTLADRERAIMGLPALATGYRKLRETLHHIALTIRIAFMGKDPCLMRELRSAEPNFLAEVSKYMADHTYLRLVVVAGALATMCTLAAAGFKVIRSMIGNESIEDVTEAQTYHKFNYELRNPITGHYYHKPKTAVTKAESKFPEMLNPGIDPSQAHLRHMQMKCSKALANTKMVRVYSKSYTTAIYTWIMFANSTCGFAVGHVFNDPTITGIALVADRECNGINFSIDQLKIENVSNGASDVHRIIFPQCVQNVKKLDHLFLPKSQFPTRTAAMRGQNLTDGASMVPVYTNTFITKPESRETNNTIANGKVLQFSDWYRSSALGTSAGDCGIPYASQNNILGIHCAACNQYTVMAPIYREWIIPHEVVVKSRKELKNIVTIGQMCAPKGTFPIAKLDRKFNVGMKNVIGVSKMAIGKPCPLKAKPVVLDEDLSMCYKYNNPDPALPRYLFEMVLGPSSELFSQSDWRLPRVRMEILSLRQAVFGDAELGVDSLDASTSVGPVLKDIKKLWSNRSQIFDMDNKTIDPEFERLCNEEWEMMTRKEMYPPLFRDCKKMELRSKDYARIFNIGDLVSLVNWKRVIGHLLSHRCSYNALGRSAFGMNPYCYEYALHVRDLQKCKYAWGEDFRGYDMSTPWFLPHLTFKWYQSWYNLRENSKEYNVALCLVKYGTTNAQHICHRTLYAVTGCNTSGQYVTGAKNDTDNVVTHYMVFIHIGVMNFGMGNFPEWYNFSHVYIKTMGDDVVIGILNDQYADKIFKLYNRVTIAHWMQELFGMTVTPAIKDQVLTPCDEDWRTIPFCKRLPVKIRGCWFGRLEKESIQGMLYYSKDVRKESVVDMESRVRSAAIETAIWGPEEFSLFEREWRDRATACGCNWSQCAGSYRERIDQLVRGYTSR